MPGVFEIEIEADILIGCMGASVGVAESGCCNGQAKVMDKWITWTGAPDHRDDLHRELVHLLGGLHDGSDKGVVWIRPGGGFAPEKIDMYIIEALRVEVGAEFPDDIFRLLVRDEAEINLG